MSVECIDSEWQKIILQSAKLVQADRTAARKERQVLPEVDDTKTPIPLTLCYPHMDIYIFVCTIMHQIVLGIMKGFFSEILPSWLKHYKKHTSFLRDFNGKVEKIRKMRLSWCKCKTANVAPGTF